MIKQEGQMLLYLRGFSICLQQPDNLPWQKR